MVNKFYFQNYIQLKAYLIFIFSDESTDSFFGVLGGNITQSQQGGRERVVVNEMYMCKIKE